jgi:hypothetical protein
MIIKCDHDNWTIETETATIPLTPPGLPFTAGNIPARRKKGTKQEAEETSRFVGNNGSR